MEISNDKDLNQLFGVYLLISKNVKYKGRVYIGFTVNPKRRIIQHNRGKDYGGAKKTSGKGPWEMILMVHGFPNEVAALRFEWAWQNPKKSRMLKDRNVDKLKYKENEISYRLRVLNKMLNTGPWYRLPLIVNIIAVQYATKILVANASIPLHMKIQHGPIITQSYVPNFQHFPQNLNINQNVIKCYLCFKYFENSIPIIICDNTKYCNMIAHIYCLANFMLQNSEHILPTDGNCPKCLKKIHYGELISKQLFIL